MRPIGRSLLTLACVLVAGAAIPVVPALATSPGVNGRIVFEANIESGNFEIYSINPDGSDRVNLTNSPGFDGNPAWSPDGTRIAFHSERGSFGGLYIMEADGSNPTLVSPSVCIVNYPAWSPDGSKIAFTDCGDDVSVVNVDGSGLTNLTKSAAFDGQPSWSPDGSRIAFARFDAANLTYDVWVMDADGSNQTNLTNNPARYEHNPDWSPDGSQIAYNSDQDIFVMNPDGSGQTNLTTTTSVSEGEPSWAPDGTRISFVVCTNAFTRCDIWTMAEDGSDSVNLTADISGSVLSEWPRWQPLPSQSDDLRLNVYWGPRGSRSLAYSNSATLESGDYDVDPSTGQPVAIGGTGTLPSTVSGDAIVTFDLALDPVTMKWSGTVVVYDLGARFSATVPIRSRRFGVTRNGTETRGVLWGFKAQSVPQKCFMFLFEIDDLN